MSGCARRIGEASPREWPAQWLFTERVVTHGAHVIEQDVELASAVAGDALYRSRTRCFPLIQKLKPGASRGSQPHFPALRGRLRSSLPEPVGAPSAGRRSATPPSPRDSPSAACTSWSTPVQARKRSLRRSPRAEPLPLTATLPQLIALTRRVALCIGGDTGPLHLASALGRPVVGIYGPTDPSRNGPYGTRARVLRSPESKRDHSRRDAPDAGLLNITPEDVLRAATELLTDDLLAEESAR